MYISYEELKAMEAEYLEKLRSVQAHLEVVNELLILASSKVKEEETVEEFQDEQVEVVEQQQ